MYIVIPPPLELLYCFPSFQTYSNSSMDTTELSTSVFKQDSRMCSTHTHMLRYDKSAILPNKQRSLVLIIGTTVILLDSMWLQVAS